MEYYLEDRKIYIYPRLLKCIGNGIEGRVYEYKNQALKIHHDSVWDKVMKPETCVELQRLKTNRILLPRKMLLDKNGNFKGYTTKLIINEQNIYEIKKQQLINELKELEKEIYYLSNQHIMLNDWHIGNFKYDGMFRFIDPGSYYYDNDISKKIRKTNYNTLKDFLFYELIMEKIKCIEKDYFSVTSEVFNKCDSRYNIYDFFDEELIDNETLEQYIKRLVKRI